MGAGTARPTHMPQPFHCALFVLKLKRKCPVSRFSDESIVNKARSQVNR